MRRIMVGLAGLGLIAASFGSAGAAPEAGAAHFQWAHADWIKMKGNSGTFMGAAGFRFVDAVHPGTFAAIFKGTCHRSTGENFIMITCSGKGMGKEIPTQDLNIHPLFDSASLQVRAAGFDNRVTWKGRGAGPVIGQGIATNGEAAVAGAFMDREAKTQGRVYGKTVRSGGWLDWGFLYSETSAGVFFGEEFNVPGLEIEVADDGTLTVHRTIRIPR